MKNEFKKPQHYWKIAEQYIQDQSKRLEDTEYYLDEKLAMKIIKFSSLIKHTAGKTANINFQFQFWQIKSLVDVFATKHREGQFKDFRRYQKVLFFMPKKNGKSELAGLLHIIMFFIDQQLAKEQYSIASDLEQALIIHDVARTMIENEPELANIVDKITVKPPQIMKRNGAFKDTFTSLSKPMGDSKDGKKVTFFTSDEGHAQPTKVLYQLMTNGMASSDEPLEIHLSTAGYNKQGYFYLDIYQYAKKVQKGIIPDDRFYSVMFELDDEEIEELEENNPDYWKDPEIWAKVNPNLGISPTMSFMHGQVSAAENSEESLVAFKTKHLNQWMDKALTWIPSRVWNNPATFTLEDFKGEKAYYGLDLSSVADLTNLTLVFKREEKIYVFQKYYIPEDNIKKRVETDRVPYLDWIRDGHLTATKGNRVDYSCIEKDIIALHQDHPIDFLGFDSWNSNYLITRLEKEDIQTVEVVQGFKTLSPACKLMEVMATDKNIIHNNNPIMAWCLDNVILTKDDNENMRPSKKNSIEKIDGVAGFLNAMVLYILNKEEESTESHYESNGLIDL
jgi:phage terminase large subunit-like protein